MEHFDQFIREYGVWAVFFWALLETDVVCIMTGVAIDLGVIPAVPALAAAVLGGVLHDFFWFGLALNRADWLRSTAVYRKVGPYVEKLVARFGVWELFLCRFVYGTRNPSLVFWGIQRLPILKFVSVNALGLIVWGGVLAGLGYFLSDRAKQFVGQVKQLERWLLWALLLALVFLAFERWVSRGRIARAAAEKARWLARLSKRKPAQSPSGNQPENSQIQK
jgi:membrane protein DedA with SNARE-associated domain